MKNKGRVDAGGRNEGRSKSMDGYKVKMKEGEKRERSKKGRKKERKEQRKKRKKEGNENVENSCCF